MLAVAQNGALRPALEFSSEPAAIASLEVYGEREGSPILATLEVAERVNGPAILTMPVQVAATREADGSILTASIPLEGLAPGRLRGAGDGQPAGPAAGSRRANPAKAVGPGPSPRRRSMLRCTRL
jgi:hypothetical protein